MITEICTWFHRFWAMSTTSMATIPGANESNFADMVRPIRFGNKCLNAATLHSMHASKLRRCLFLASFFLIFFRDASLFRGERGARFLMCVIFLCRVKVKVAMQCGIEKWHQILAAALHIRSTLIQSSQCVKGCEVILSCILHVVSDHPVSILSYVYVTFQSMCCIFNAPCVYVDEYWEIFTFRSLWVIHVYVAFQHSVLVFQFIGPDL